MSIGSLLGGTAAIEMLFVMPGMGYMVTNAVTGRDYPVIQGFVVQDAYQIGYQGIKTLNAAVSGQFVPKEIDIPVKFVHANNIDTPEIDNLLHTSGTK